MKKLFVAVLFVAGVAGIGSAHAGGLWNGWGGCGVGCHATWNGQCVVDGWESGAPIAPNQCPVGTFARPPCPFGYVWRPRSHACFALN
jgi:hypothetical protein